MNAKYFLNRLLSNVLLERSSIYCRLCLNFVSEKYLRFDDLIEIGETSFASTVAEVLSSIFGAEFGETIPGLEVLCSSCSCKVSDWMKFRDQCEKSNKTVDNIFDNLTTALNNKFDSRTQSIFIALKDNSCEVVVNIEDENCQDKLECLNCKEIYSSEKDLANHYFTQHNLIKCIKCKELCLKDAYTSHSCIKSKHQCSECSVTKSSEESLRTHYDKAHKVYMCCNKNIIGYRNLQKHEHKHTSLNSCPKCKKIYYTKEFYDKHIQACMDDNIDPHPLRSSLEKSYACNICDKKYFSPGGLKVHMKFEHGNGKSHICEYCGKKFTAPSALKTHMVKHTGEKNHIPE